jgi:DNA-binding NarL/FixJ family response regulator
MTKRLLLVDDEPRLLRAVAATLRDAGYFVDSANSGAEALLSLSTNLPDLIITDIRMPGMDGYQLTKILRLNPRTELIPLIFLTAKDEREDRIVGLRAGVDAYVTKPFDPEELLAVVANILDRSARIRAELGRMLQNYQENDSSRVKNEQLPDLTEAELRVGKLVSNGLSNKEIAAELQISVRTVEGHISNILSKGGWSNRVEIARYLLRNNDLSAG